MTDAAKADKPIFPRDPIYSVKTKDGTTGLGAHISALFGPEVFFLKVDAGRTNARAELITAIGEIRIILGEKYGKPSPPAFDLNNFQDRLRAVLGDEIYAALQIVVTPTPTPLPHSESSLQG